MRPKAPVATVVEFDSVVQSAAEKRAADVARAAASRGDLDVPLPPELAGTKEDDLGPPRARVWARCLPGPGDAGTEAGRACHSNACSARGVTEEEWKAGILRSY